MAENSFGMGDLNAARAFRSDAQANRTWMAEGNSGSGKARRGGKVQGTISTRPTPATHATDRATTRPRQEPAPAAAAVAGKDLTGYVPPHLKAAATVHAPAVHDEPGKDLTGWAPPRQSKPAITDQTPLVGAEVAGKDLTGYVAPHLKSAISIPSPVVAEAPGKDLTGWAPPHVKPAVTTQSPIDEVPGKDLTGWAPEKPVVIAQSPVTAVAGKDLTGYVPPHMKPAAPTASPVAASSVVGKDLTGWAPPHLRGLASNNPAAITNKQEATAKTREQTYKLPGAPAGRAPGASGGSSASSVATATEPRRVPIGFTSLMDELKQEATRETQTLDGGPDLMDVDMDGITLSHASRAPAVSASPVNLMDIPNSFNSAEWTTLEPTLGDCLCAEYGIKGLYYSYWNKLQGELPPDSQRPFTHIPESDKKHYLCPRHGKTIEEYRDVRVIGETVYVLRPITQLAPDESADRYVFGQPGPNSEDIGQRRHHSGPKMEPTMQHPPPERRLHDAPTGRGLGASRWA